MTTASRIDLRAELRHVARRFEDFLRGLGAASRTVSPDPGIRPDNIALVLPYFLVEALPFPRDHHAARSMAAANAFGAAHFLIQDRLIDGDEGMSPTALELSDRLFAEFLRGYRRLSPLDRGFWRDLDRYLSEYFESLAWEARVLRTCAGAEAADNRALPETLRRLGHRMAPLKVSGAAVARLAGRLDGLADIEQFVDSFHAGYQLADDIEDLEEDLARGRWSVVAWMLASAVGRSTPPDPANLPAALEARGATAALGSVTELIMAQYRRALGAARSLGSRSLVDYVERLIDCTSREHGRLLRRLSLSVGPRPPAPANTEAATEGVPLDGVHAFAVGNQSYVFDVASGLFFEADPLAMDLISWLQGGAEPVDLRVLEMDHGSEHVREGLAEIALLRGSADAHPDSLSAVRANAPVSGISSLALHLTARCNLRCDYCYHARRGREGPPMSVETATRAIDFLFEESVGERNVSVVFFGGEPLLRPDLIERTVEHAKAVATRVRRRVSFHVTTNGTLLDVGLASRLNELGVRILVSIDGTEADHDRHRIFPDGRGSYRAIRERLASLPAGTRVGARATVTPESGPLRDTVAHLSDLGCGVVHLAPVSDGDMPQGFSERLRGEFEELARDELARMLDGGGPIVGNFVEALASLDTGRVRLLPCGAGARYLSVGADGTLFLCHRFAGDAAYAVGSAWDGVDLRKLDLLLRSLDARARGCASCWARWLCGGPCFYDLVRSAGGSTGRGAPRCALRTRILELAMWLYASLPTACRERAIGNAGGRRGLDSGSRSGAAVGADGGSVGETNPAGL